jgi:transposase InsO family protein
MGADVESYVKSCDVCQKTKIKRHKPYGTMQALPSPDQPWKEIALDFMSGVPLSMRDGVAYDAILVVVDRYSKMALYFPVSKTITAVQTADILIDRVFSRFGFPSGIVSDRDPRFTSEFWSDLCYYAKITRRMSTAFHPQTDGQTERQNQTLQEYLRSFCTTCQMEWAKQLPIAEFAYNNAIRSDLGVSPFRVVLGYDPQMYFDTEDSVPEGRIPAAKERIKHLAELRKDLQKRLEDASKSQAKYYNRKHQPISFKKGDLVLVSTKNLRLRDASKKLSQRLMGPFRIDEPVGSQAYRVHLPTASRIHDVFHVSAMEPYHQRAGTQEILLPPDIIDDQEEYEVEEILDTTRKRGVAWYLVKWKGWPDEYNQWLTQEDMPNAAEAVQEFQDKKKQKRGAIKSKRGRKSRR